jgi:hypothetical protein
MKKAVKGYWQNAVNHIITTVFGIACLIGAGVYFWQNIATFKTDLALNSGVLGLLVLLGFIGLGAKDKINLLQKNITK